MFLNLLLVFLLVLIYNIYRAMLGSNNPIIVIIQPHIADTPNEAAQNVHDSQVRQNLLEKYYKLREEVFLETTAFTKKSLLQVARGMPAYLRNICTTAEFRQLNTIVTCAFNTDSTVTGLRNDIIPESEIFSVCYFKYRKMGLDKETMLKVYLDCISEGTTVCVTGRVSRYIGMFEGIAEGYLGETEETEEIAKTRVTNRVYHLFREMLAAKPELEKEYDSNAMELSENTTNFLTEIKEEISKVIMDENPGFSRAELSNILSAVS
jgi:hypothetical protein